MKPRMTARYLRRDWNSLLRIQERLSNNILTAESFLILQDELDLAIPLITPLDLLSESEIQKLHEKACNHSSPTPPN